MFEEITKDISVVIPLFNEEGSLRELYSKIRDVLIKADKSYEVIFIDDGSTDSSSEVLKVLKARDANVVTLSLRRHFGKAAALMAGFKKAKGKTVITMDADLQDDPEEISKFLKTIDEGYDLVCGWKYNRKDPIGKKLLSKIFNSIVASFGRINLHDINCGFKAYKKDVVENINIYGELHRFIPVIAKWEGYRIAEVKVRHHARKHGKSKYGSSRILKGFLDFVTILFLTKFQKRPLHLFGIFGLFCILPGAALNIYFGWQWVITGHLHVRPLLVLSWILLILGIQFFSIGLLGEMISNIKSHGAEKELIKDEI